MVWYVIMLIVILLLWSEIIVKRQEINRILKKKENLHRMVRLHRMTFVALQSSSGQRIFTPDAGLFWYLVDEEGKILGLAESLAPQAVKELEYKMNVVDKCRFERETQGVSEYTVDHSYWQFEQAGIFNG